MSETERLVKFTLLGQEYRFYTAASEEEMDRILGLVKKLVDDSGGGSGAGAVPNNKIAVMACLNLASQYVRLKKDFEEYKKESNRRILHINSQINEALEDETAI